MELATCLQNKKYLERDHTSSSLVVCSKFRCNMKNGWYNRIYREDLPPCDYWEPNNDVVYIENNLVVKRKNECYHTIEEIKDAIVDLYEHEWIEE